ncbi:hypothetical protein, partial [Xanthomonas citri]
VIFTIHQCGKCCYIPRRAQRLSADLSHPLEQISERKLLPKFPFPGPADLPLVCGAFLFVFSHYAQALQR